MIHTDSESGGISTIVIRGATDNILDDIERGLNDGINTFKALTKVFQRLPFCLLSLTTSSLRTIDYWLEPEPLKLNWPDRSRILLRFVLKVLFNRISLYFYVY